jgi:hypothetical protein
MDLLLLPLMALAENHPEATPDRKVAVGNLLLVVANPVNLGNVNHSTSTKTKATTEVDHDHHRLPIPKDLLQDHHQEAEHHPLIVPLGERHPRRV